MSADTYRAPSARRRRHHFLLWHLTPNTLRLTGCALSLFKQQHFVIACLDRLLCIETKTRSIQRPRLSSHSQSSQLVRHNKRHRRERSLRFRFLWRPSFRFALFGRLLPLALGSSWRSGYFWLVARFSKLRKSFYTSYLS